MKTERIFGPRSLSNVGFCCFFCAREVPAIEIKNLEVKGPSLWIRSLRQLVGNARFLKPSDMGTNRGHPVMGPLKIGSSCENLSERGDGLGVLEIPRRAPQDPRSSQMSLR